MNCKIAGCNHQISVHTARGMCNMHYLRWWRKGDCGPASSLVDRHGMRRTRMYTIWRDMIARCHNPKYPESHYYGAKGIVVCEKWRLSFSGFLNDMGKPPSARHQIDRIENDKGYFKENCRWVLPVQNQRNRSNLKLSIEKARQIRALNATGITPSKLALLFGVSLNNVCNILNQRIWKEINN